MYIVLAYMLANRHVFKQAVYSALSLSQPTATHHIKIPTSDMDWFSYKSLELISYTYNCQCTANIRDGHRSGMFKFNCVRSSKV